MPCYTGGAINAMKLSIDSHFDSGNIRVLDINANPLRLAIEPDHDSHFYQWFYFCVSGGKGRSELRLCLENASGAAFPEGWNHYQVVASYDRQEWFRVPSHYHDGQLFFDHGAQYDQVWYAYFAPYSWERHLDVLAWAQQSANCRSEQLGQTLDGRPLHLLTVGEASPGKYKVWLTARQHPGETMAQWAMEGLLQQLLDPQDACARRLLQQAVFYLLPNMNPDGSVRGHLRTNAAGVNLNREWQTPNLSASPEVALTLQRMHDTGVDLFIDLHGDEEIPYVFLVTNEGIPGYSHRLQQLEQQFKAQLLRSCADFQTTYGYPLDKPGQANMTMASCAVGQAFDCLSLTLEMPFIDNHNLPDTTYGWSVERSRATGRALLPTMAAIMPELR